MSQVIVDPDELRRFAVFLEQSIRNLRDGQRGLQRGHQVLADAWRDSKYNNFAKSFDQTLPALERFCKEAEAYAAFLRRKAQLADRYLGRN